MVRNPKDVAVSWYHHYSMLMGYTGSLEDFLEAFINDSIIYSPYFDHFIEFWHMRNEENILFITYEEMKKNTKDVLKSIAKFLNKSYTDEQFDQLTEHVSFESMKSRKFYIVIIIDYCFNIFYFHFCRESSYKQQ